MSSSDVRAVGAEQKAGAGSPMHHPNLSFSGASASAPTMSVIFTFFLNFFKLVL